MKITYKLKASLLMMALPLMANAQNLVTLSADDFKIDAGKTATFAVNMENEGEQISDAQFDLQLPEGLTFVSAEVASERSNGHSIKTNEVEGKTRVMVSGNMLGNPFKDNRGAIAKVTVQASSSFETGRLGFSRIFLSTPNGGSIQCDNFDIEANPPIPETIEGVKFFADNLSLDAEGKGELAIFLDNPQYSVTSVQFDMTLPTGLKITNVKNTDRSKNLTVMNSELPSGKIRVVMVDGNGEFRTISGTEGAICNIALETTDKYFKSGKIQFDKIKLANRDNLKATPADMEVTINATAGIENATFNEQMTGSVYNLQGIKVATENMNKGIYIQNGKKFVVK